MARSFVSRFLGERLSRPEPLDGPERHRVGGAVLLSDIEGFTAHVEELAGRGPAGLERLAARFNAYFAALVDAVHARHGDILVIAGDSFLSWWPAKRDGLVSAALRALDGGLAIQQALAQLSDGEDAGLSTRIGIAAGDLTIGIAGGLCGRWELVPWGPAISRVRQIEREARAGTVAVDAAVMDLVGTRARGRPAGDGSIELTALEPAAGPVTGELETPPPPVALERLTPFVPAPVLAWGQADQEWLAELRPVTVVMARLGDREKGAPGHGHERDHRALFAFQEVMQRFGGASKLLFDNKGLTCSGVFGLPPRAHEDDVDRGLRSARRINQELEQLGFRCALGVASGRVFCGVFGTPARREYTLFGDVVNLASRLSGSNRCEVLVDAASIQASSMILELERRPMLALKGRRDPVLVHRLVELRRPASRQGRAVVGREHQRATIASSVQALTQAGQRATLVIEGEPGLGKTTLAAEAAEQATRAGAQCWWVTPDLVEGATALHAWRPVFAALLGEAPSPDAIVRHLGGDRETSRLLPLLNGILPLGLAETPTTEAMSGEVRSDQTNALLTRLLQLATQAGPALLVVEDAQWLDSNSWALLLGVAARVAQLVTLVTERAPLEGEPLLAERARLRSLPGAQFLTLAPLTAPETSALVCHCLGTETVSPEILALIHERAAGHPFFSEALVETLVGSGVIHVTDAGAELTGDARAVVPVSIESAVLSRLDRLGPGEQLASKAAAVVGRRFTIAEVAAARRVAPEEMADHLEALRRLGITQPEAREGERVYAFRHQIIHDVAYALIPDAQRRPLHRALAEWYEATLSEGERGTHPQLLAHHWIRSSEPTRALDYLETAGRHALRDGAFNEAAELLAEAIALAPHVEPARRALQEKSLADAHYFLGDLLRSRALLEQALERIDQPVPAGRLALLRSVGRGLAAQAAHLALPRRYQGSRAAERRTLTPAVDALRTLVQISYLHATSTLEVTHLVVAALNLGEQAGPSPELACALANAACLADILRLSPLADRYAGRATRMAEEEEHSLAAAYVWNVLAIMQGQRGRWGDALEANSRALELFGELGDYNLEAELWQTRSALQLCRGGLDAAEVAWMRTRELAARTGNAVNRCWSLLDEAQTELARGRNQRAVSALEEALAIPTLGSDGGTVIERRATTALARLRQGRLAEAVSESDAVIDMVSASMPTSWVWAEFCALAIEVLLELRASPEPGVPLPGLERRIRRGLFALGRLAITFRGVRPRLWLLRARAAMLAGDLRAADRQLDRAERAATRPDQAHDRARVGMLRAELCDVPARRAELLGPVLESLRELGALGELAHAEALLK